MIDLHSVSVSRGAKTILHCVSANLAEGRYYILRGRNGSGKSTLLKAIAGLVQPSGGRITIAGRDPESCHASSVCRIGYLGQDPAAQILLPRLSDEVASGALSVNLEGDALEVWILELIEQFGLDRLVGANNQCFLLSAGQQQLVALATVLAKQPAVLLLDEPTSMLDETNAQRFGAAVQWFRLRFPKSVIVHATHEDEDWTRGDLTLTLVDGALADGNAGKAEVSGLNSETGALPLKCQPSAVKPGQDPLVDVIRVSVSFGGSRQVFSDLSFRLAAGEVVTVVGDNGSGKSTLLDLLVGWISPHSGTIKRRHGLKVGLMAQRVDDTLLSRTVSEELEISLDPRVHRDRSRTVKDMLASLRLEGIANRDVLSLSGGEKRLIALCAAAVSCPDLLLLDEPLAGLDVDYRRQMKSFLAAYVADRSRTVVTTANRRRDAQDCADRVVALPGRPS